MIDAPPAETGPRPAAKEPAFSAVLGRVSVSLDAERIGAGPLAELRRMGWREFPPEFWRFYLKYVPPAWRGPKGCGDDKVDLAWASLLRAMAEGAPNPHCADSGFGAALAETGYAEQRFVRFLRASGEDLAREARAAAAWLARAGRGANWREPAELLLARIGGVRHVRPPRTVTHRLARGYFRAQAAASRSTERREAS